MEAEKIFDVGQEVYQNQNPKFEPKNLEFFTELKNKFTYLSEKFISIRMRIMDLYTLARIFHKFEDKTQEQREKNFPEYATNIIYYAGSDHIVYILNLLKEFGFNEIYTSGPKASEKACIFAPTLEKLEEKLISRG